ncbi:Bcr/CflA family efflux MFS transporter [Gordonia sp. HNM0687]|uniref:Bcr/CflA family efflux MFS transporter n=1 Tax=Gordonia mangrovi TaxID=2665643 RepID=A0A6L7GPE6_9ACTN|nr:multidrug effflux MFS transporter [Gordonia mangrovi]MXP21736.1 Bcr/CflA family efflux MFS transporter [Gordonia mangrovi]UVF80466.1 multidrug effflux MFS transporter [Gordonia mangrovi]
MSTELTHAEADSAHAAAGPRPVGGALLLVLALLSAVAPFATDMYLPAFPQMTEELSVSATAVQLSLTAFLVGVTIGQLVFGPISDRWGRRSPLLAGAVLCVVASAIVVWAPNITVLVVARFAQGLGGAAGMVIGRAIISDLARGKDAARAFSLMMIVVGVAPVVAPLVGGFLVGPIGWRGILAVVLALAVAMMVSTVAVIRETLPPERRAAISSERRGSSSPLAALRSRAFLGYAVAFAFAFAVMMAYISASPFLYQEMIGLGAAGYGLAFGANALALMVTSAVAARLTRTRSVRSLVGAGVSAILVFTGVLGMLVILDVGAGWLALPIFGAVGSCGLVFGNATALALQAVPEAAGSASAILGAAQFALAAVVSPLVSIRGENTAGPLAVVMLMSAVIAVLAFLFAAQSGTTTARPRRSFAASLR